MFRDAENVVNDRGRMDEAVRKENERSKRQETWD